MHFYTHPVTPVNALRLPCTKDSIQGVNIQQWREEKKSGTYVWTFLQKGRFYANACWFPTKLWMAFDKYSSLYCGLLYFECTLYHMQAKRVWLRSSSIRQQRTEAWMKNVQVCLFRRRESERCTKDSAYYIKLWEIFLHIPAKSLCF